MLKALKAFVAWAERRWPERVVVTMENFEMTLAKAEAAIEDCEKMGDAIIKLESQAEQLAQEKLAERVAALETSVKNMNHMMGLTMPRDGQNLLLQR